MRREVWLEEALGLHRTNMSLFAPFVVARLHNASTANHAEISVILRDVDVLGDSTHALHLQWRPETIPALPLGVNEKTITEFAACGIAAIVAITFADLEIRAVAQNGDRFDYWLWDGMHGFGMEVSGTLSEELPEFMARHREKIEQLQTNPFGVDGFVAIVSFVLQQVLFSFHCSVEAI